MGDRRVFSGYSYRTSSRFGSHVEIEVVDGAVTVTGRRIGRGTRDAWVGAQAGLMTLLLVRILQRLSGRRRTHITRTFLAEFLVASFGALLLWWPADRGPGGLLEGDTPEQRDSGAAIARRSYSSWTFPLTAVSDVRLTPWYSRRGLWFIAWPWQLPSLLFPWDPREVVFEVPVDDEAPREKLVFAIALGSAEEAAGLFEALKAR